MSSLTPDRPPCCASLLEGSLPADFAVELAEMFKALSDPVRLRLVSLIAASGGGGMCACDLPGLLQRSQPTVSHHLSQLVKAGILAREQRGKWAWFRLEPQRLETLRLYLAPTQAGQ